MAVQQLKLYAKVFFTFLKISAFTFGGGYAVLPLLNSEVVDKNKWMTEEEVTDVFTMSQIVPGMIYVSSATFIGYRVSGVIGACLAAVAVLLPSALAMIILTLFLSNFFDNAIIQKIFNGIIIGVTAMLAAVGFSLLRKSVNNYFTIAIFIISFILIEFIKIKVFILIFTGIIIGAIYAYIMFKQKGSNLDA